LAFVACGLAFTVDPKLCALKEVRDPMHVPVWLFAIFYKPYHLYMIYRYYTELCKLKRLLAMISEVVSSTSYSSDTPPPSPNTLEQATHDYEFDQSMGLSDPVISSDYHGHETLAPNVQRKFNVTNIPAASDQVDHSKVTGDKKIGKILGWGTGKNYRLPKVHPLKNSKDDSK